jgi:hypothetical protein
MMNAQTKVEAATLASAMAAAFSEIEAATKRNENAAFKQGGKVSKYADINAVIEAIKPALINHGLFFTQHPHPSENGVTVETVLHHAGGEMLSLGALFVPANKNDAHGFGSALTYARRYALVTAFGVPVEDDDGNAAARGTKQESAVSPPQPITDADVAKLIQLVEATSANVPAMLKYLGIALPNDNLALLNREQHDKVLDALNAKLAAMAKAETNAKATENA